MGYKYFKLYIASYLGACLGTEQWAVHLEGGNKLEILNIGCHLLKDEQRNHLQKLCFGPVKGIP